MFSGLLEASADTFLVRNLNILHCNERSHTAAAVMDLLRRWKWEILEYPPYSTDTSPCDYDPFAKVTEPLQGPSTTQKINLPVL